MVLLLLSLLEAASMTPDTSMTASIKLEYFSSTHNRWKRVSSLKPCKFYRTVAGGIVHEYLLPTKPGTALSWTASKVDYQEIVGYLYLYRCKAFKRVLASFQEEKGVRKFGDEEGLEFVQTKILEMISLIITYLSSLTLLDDGAELEGLHAQLKSLIDLEWKIESSKVDSGCLKLAHEFYRLESNVTLAKAIQSVLDTVGGYRDLCRSKV